MDIDNLRRSWQQQNIDTPDIDSHTHRVLSDISSGKVQTSQMALARHFRRQSFAGLCVVALAPTLYYILEMPVWIAAFYGAFGAVMMALCLAFSSRLRHMDIISKPVVQALADVLSIRRTMRMLNITGICFGAMVIGVMAADISERSELHMLYGMLIGLIVGIPIGLVKYLRSRRIARALEAELRTYM